MKSLIVPLIIGIFFTSVIHAQTPTPTVSARDEGFYEFEELSAPAIQLTGTWAINTVDGRTFLQTSEANASARFNVRGEIAFFHYMKLATNEVTDGFSIEMDGYITSTPSTYASTNTYQSVNINLGPLTEVEVVITNTSGVLRLDSLMVLQGASYATPPAESIYFDDGNGQGMRFDYAATAGDLINGMLMFLVLFSLWGFFILYILILRKER